MATVEQLGSAILASLLVLTLGCSTRGGVSISGNEGGSSPINKGEVTAYKKALLKCYKTGGNRVVKIEGRLRCY